MVRKNKNSKIDINDLIVEMKYFTTDFTTFGEKLTITYYKK